MPPSQLGRPRNPDDSRSDASSAATKDRLSNIMSASVISKAKKSGIAQHYAMENGTSIPPLNRSSQIAPSAIMEAGEPELARVSISGAIFTCYRVQWVFCVG